jgi:hypothetical protein
MIEARLSGEACSPPKPCPAEGFGVCRVRFPHEVIVVAVRWYLRYGLSYRDVGELLLERGVEVDHVTVFRWVQRFTPLLADAARLCRHAPGDRWFVDETFAADTTTWTRHPTRTPRRRSVHRTRRRYLRHGDPPAQRAR